MSTQIYIYISLKNTAQLQVSWKIYIVIFIANIQNINAMAIDSEWAQQCWASNHTVGDIILCSACQSVQ